MNQPIESLQQADTLVAPVAGTDFSNLDDETLCGVLANAEQLRRHLDAVTALSAAEIEDRSRYGLGTEGLAQRHGFTRGTHLVEAITGTSQAEAARRIRLGGAIRPRHQLDGQPLSPAYPVVAEAMIAGTMGADAAGMVTRILDQAARHHADRAGLDTAEADLVEFAATEPADLVAVRARVWREYLDPDGAEPREEELRKRRQFRLGRQSHGLTRFSGACDPVFAAKLRAAFTEAAAPGGAVRFLSPEDQAGGTQTIEDENGEPVTVIRDTRTREQRQLDVLEGLVTAGLRSTETGNGTMRSTANISISIQLEDLENGTGIGWIEDIDEPIPASRVQELLCDAGYQHIVLDPNGQPLYLGHTKRFFTPAQKKAMALRDGGCVANGCTAPPEWCDGHHIDEVVAHNGKTDINNGVLLCPEHHRWFHRAGYQMRMIRGKPHQLAPFWIDPSQTWQPLGKSRHEIARKLRKTG